ncbi:hypothetical protein HAX54_025845 [Datura stramonium]|uniref:Trichome birefringence-like N-terminal domain-containing protein n=1 Tax=Datura stramonium TaxID=4076 RepID=A0ABS8S6J1_DATST|nr:hypothetical protein [Datura stramonium]
MPDDFACHKFGRKDSKYHYWRWQPYDCDLPRFNGKALLEKLKGKRVLFVGDSLNKNQWASMVCLIESSGIPSLKPVIYKGNLIIFEVKFAFFIVYRVPATFYRIGFSCEAEVFHFPNMIKEYNATIDFYWSPLLVESNCDDPVNQRIRDRIIRIEAIEKHSRHWNDADILIFDSFTWWHEHQMTLLWGSFNSSDAIYKKVGMKLRRYEMALRTWSDWLEVQIDRNRTTLFFMSLSPSHKNGTDWGMGNDQTCYDEAEPISRKQYWGSQTDRKMMEIAEDTVNGLKRKGLDIQYLNITQLSDYRKGHPSIYKRNWVAPTKEQLLTPRSNDDCVHWCLPGVPDDNKFERRIESGLTSKESPIAKLKTMQQIKTLKELAQGLTLNEHNSKPVELVHRAADELDLRHTRPTSEVRPSHGPWRGQLPGMCRRADQPSMRCQDDRRVIPEALK